MDYPIKAGNLRDIQVGNPANQGAVLSFNRDLTSNVAGSVPNPNQIGMQVMDLLRQYQLKATTQGLNAQQEQANRLSAPVDSALIGASPDIQNKVRSASVGAVDPTITGAGETNKTIEGFLGQVRDSLQFYQQVQEKSKSDARDLVKNALTLFGSNAANIIPKETWRQAGYSIDAVNHLSSTLKEQELALKTQAAEQTSLLREQTALAREQKMQLINQEQDDIKRNGQLIFEGYTVPSLVGGFGSKKSQVVAEADRISMKETGKHYNQAKAELEYAGAKRFVSSLNSPQQVRFNTLGVSVVNTIDEIRQLANQLKLVGVPLVNKVKLEAYIQTAGNTEGGQLVSQYLAATNTLKEEFANLVNGGYAPTEAAFALANKQVNENYGVNQLTASLIEVQRLINFRLSAQTQISPIGTSGGLQLGGGSTSGGGESIDYYRKKFNY